MKKFLAGIAALVLLANLSNVDAKSKKSDEKIPTAEIEESIHARGERVFPIGRANTTYAKYFTGRSYVAPIAMGEGFSVMNVTFEHSSRQLSNSRWSCRARLLSNLGAGCCRNAARRFSDNSGRSQALAWRVRYRMVSTFFDNE